MSEHESDPVMRHLWSAPGWESERPSGEGTELWCYTDRFSYLPGETVNVHVHTTAPTYAFEVIRDGARPVTVLRKSDIPGQPYETPEDCYARGCNWPVAFSFEIPDDWESGFYLLVVRTVAPDGIVWEREHFIVVRAKTRGATSGVALLLTTSTLLAYNDWGGANQYRGLGDTPWVDVPSPISSTQRPIARGMLRIPPGVPRNANPATPPPNAPPRYPILEWSRVAGYSRHYADAFWALYERPFVVWAEQNGYRLEYLTQHDLHFDREALNGYKAVVIVGHDEYWTAPMRDAIDRFVDRGGMMARFGGNILWQVRLSDDGTQQICYRQAELDPYHDDPALRHLTTTCWDLIDQPAATTFGLTGAAGCYARYGDAVPRSSGGFTVYRPEHWIFEGTGLRYGDVLGGLPACIAAFEMDGLDYTFRYGLPYPTGSDSPPETLEILAMTPAVIGERDFWNGQVIRNSPEEHPFLILAPIAGDRPVETIRFGSGMVASFTRGYGLVVNAGTTEWVNGLIVRDPFVEIVTRNVLDRCVTGTEAG